jgi:hypothetical protein
MAVMAMEGPMAVIAMEGQMAVMAMEGPVAGFGGDLSAEEQAYQQAKQQHSS